MFMTDYWSNLLGRESLTKEDLFFKIRDMYAALLRNLYNEPKTVPDFNIHFSAVPTTQEEGMENGYPIITVTRKSNKLKEYTVKDLSMIENFENSYTWYADDVFAVFDFREDGISPLQFITSAFCTEFFRQTEIYGIRRIRMSHMYEMMISSGVSEFFYGFYRIDINFILTLSAMTYEGDAIDCTIYVPRFDSAAGKRTARKGLDIVFSDSVPFSIENLRQIRKLVELSDKHFAIVINEAGRIRGLTFDEPYQTECKIRMWDNLAFTITYEGTGKISYYNAHYHIHTDRSRNFSAKKYLGEFSGSLTEEKLNMLERVIEAAARQRHGTIMIIGNPEMIEAESERLCNAKVATGINTVNLYEKSELISYITSIDGAVLMDTDCRCRCIGAILDGDAVTRGSPARGARYNSTVNYINRRAQLDEYFVGIVVSEDGTVDSVTKDHIYRINVR